MPHVDAESRRPGRPHPRVGEEEAGTDVPIDLRERWAGEFEPLGAALPVGVITAVGMGTAVYLNEAAVALLGRPVEELLGHGWEATVHPDDRAELVAAIAVLLDSGVRQRLVIRTGDEPGRSLELTFAVLGADDDPTGWVATIDDVSERVQAERRLAHDATHDQLTQLPNRALLADRILQAGNRLERAEPGSVLALLFLDLDDFKAVNDRYGHAAGDDVLRTTAARLSHTVRAGDTVARLGGDEFVAVCELTDADELDGLVARVEASVEMPIHLRDGTVTPHASIGIAVATSVDDPDELLDEADREMYVRKTTRATRGEGGR
jgi:diguanylate cyclase (GGDEF)-like protein/PAS domain S-box-containing protein